MPQCALTSFFWRGVSKFLSNKYWKSMGNSVLTRDWGLLQSAHPTGCQFWHYSPLHVVFLGTWAYTHWKDQRHLPQMNPTTCNTPALIACSAYLGIFLPIALNNPLTMWSLEFFWIALPAFLTTLLFTTFCMVGVVFVQELICTHASHQYTHTPLQTSNQTMNSFAVTRFSACF